MKIYLAYSHIDSPWGGANNFQRVMYEKMSEYEDVIFVKDICDADIVFYNQLGRGPGASNKKMYSIKDIKNSKAIGAKVVIRAIGLFSVTYKDNIIHRYIDYKIIKALKLADTVIFQSKMQYDMFKTKGFCCEEPNIIHNGADGNMFAFLRRSLKTSKPLRLISASSATRKQKRHDIIANISMLDNIEVCHVGSWPNEVDSKKVNLLGKLDHREMATVYKDCHAFIHAAEFDTCPNVVIEAMLSGLPVLYNKNLESGDELIGRGGVSFDELQLKKSIENLKNSYDDIVEYLYVHRNHFEIQRAVESYYKCFRDLCVTT